METNPTMKTTLPQPLLTIRQATVADASALRSLRLEALLDRPEAFAMDHETAAQESVADWEKRLNDQTSTAIFVAVADGNLVGLTGIGFRPWPKIQHNGTIWGVYVQPEWRGRGISNQLIEACANWGKKRAIRLLRLGVITTNSSAVESYKRSGFRVYATDPQAVYYNGRYYDEWLMIREI